MNILIQKACMLCAMLTIGILSTFAAITLQFGDPEFDCDNRSRLVIPVTVAAGTADQIESISFVDKTSGYNKMGTLNGARNQLTLSIGGMNPGTYRGNLVVKEAGSMFTKSYPYSFSIWFEGSVFKFKYYNVLAVYDKQYNGGYDFTAYQWWWKNQADTLAADSVTVIEPVFKPIEGATSAIYHSAIELVPEDEYYVVLTYTDAQGNVNTVRSCPQTIINKHPEEEAKSAVRKTCERGRLLIRKDEHTYDVYGNLVE